MNNNTETKKIAGDVFIIPNVNGKFKDCTDFAQECAQIRFEGLGLDLRFEPDDTLVETWCCNKESDNWHCHGLKINGETTLPVGCFPSDFPARIFMGKKEGDKITLHSTVLNVDIELTLNQLAYRYRNFGPFEEVLTHVSGE